MNKIFPNTDTSLSRLSRLKLQKTQSSNTRPATVSSLNSNLFRMSILAENAIKKELNNYENKPIDVPNNKKYFEINIFSNNIINGHTFLSQIEFIIDTKDALNVESFSKFPQFSNINNGFMVDSNGNRCNYLTREDNGLLKGYFLSKNSGLVQFTIPAETFYKAISITRQLTKWRNSNRI